MTTLHGIPNCDTVKKARTWLESNGVAYTFHDFKKQGVSADMLAGWLKHVPLTTLLNRKGTTWRALSDADKARAEDEAGAIALMQANPSLIKRPVLVHGKSVNVGFSGGEKKRNEVLQMALFEPSLCILDEMDSGLDIDALRIAADGVNALRSKDRAMIVITHYQRLLNYIVPDFVHVMSKGRVVKSGGKDLALELEESGYAQFEDVAA